MIFLVYLFFAVAAATSCLLAISILFVAAVDICLHQQCFTLKCSSKRDVPVTWVGSARTLLSCQIPDADRIVWRHSPPPLKGEDRQSSPRGKQFTWRHNNEELKRSSSNGTLEVSRRKGSSSSNGVYQCSLKHPFGGTVLGYPVHLKFASLDKQLSVYPANSTAWRGQPHVLTCNVTSEPPALISWLKDGKPLPDDDRYQTLQNQLLILNIEDKDAGLYKCRATNPHANRTRTSHVGRVQVGDLPPAPPSFLPVRQESEIVVPRGSRVVLPCLTVADPKPVLIWTMTPPGKRVEELESTDELLVMPAVELDQEGVYVCRFEGNSDLVKVFNVTITSPVTITHPPESKQVLRASTVRFNCTATGNPPPEITWYKNGKELSLSGRIEVLPSAEDKSLLQLLIRSVTFTDAGVYQCFARNPSSVKSSWATLNVTGGKAAAPVSVRCQPAGIREVKLYWTYVPNVVAYTVHHTVPGGKLLAGIPVTNNETLVKVESPLTPYMFLVQAYIGSPTEDNTNLKLANIVSELSEAVTCQGQGVPIKLSKVDEDSIVVSWRGFASENPGVMEWILQYKAVNSSDEHNVTLDGRVYNYTLHVSPTEPLQVRVLGTSSLPWLQQNLTLVPWTATAAAGRHRSGEVRTIPEYVEVTEVNPRNITVRWRCEDELSNTYSFLVCTRRVGGNEECLESYVNSVQVTNLQPNSEYEVRVQARLPGQTLGGEFSPSIHISTPSEDQRDFKDLTYKFINATTIRVSWNSEPRVYTVRYTTNYEIPLKQWTAVETVGNTVLLTGLDPSKNLSLIVEGHEPVGSSQLLTIPAQIPEVKDVQYTYTRGGVTVTWRGRGPRVVMYSQNLTRPLDSWRVINVTDTSVQITGLDPNLHTFVMVTAPGPSERNHVLTIKPRPPESSNIYLGIGIGVGVLLLCAVAAAAVCVWAKRKRTRSPVRARRRRSSQNENETDGPELRNIGGRLANGGGSKDAGEPLLNGHVHITENPSQSKTPNGKIRKPRYEVAFDVTRYDDADVTQETVLEADISTNYHLLDTSRRPEYDIVTANSFAKLPDDNMNSELARVQIENSKILPTLEPNG